MLSGGIDSTLLAALITRYNENLTAINMTIYNDLTNQSQKNSKEKFRFKFIHHLH